MSVLIAQINMSEGWFMFGDRRRLAGLVFILAIAFGGIAHAQSNLPPEVQRDVIVVQLTDAMKEKRYGDALKAIDQLRGLSVPLPGSVGYFEADAAVNSGDFLRAERALTAYLAKASKQDPTYTPAIRLYAKVTEEAKKQLASLENYPTGAFNKWASREYLVRYSGSSSKWEKRRTREITGYCQKNGTSDRCGFLEKSHWLSKHNYYNEGWRTFDDRNAQSCLSLDKAKLLPDLASIGSAIDNQIPEKKKAIMEMVTNSGYVAAIDFGRRERFDPSGRPYIFDSHHSEWVYLTAQDLKS
jgi:hypothetical protein